ncbi:MAG TPA: sialidase family protein [Kofleriaceae bacterium]|nr:sialidase family protein [Kofleriaceae bacterium]
MRRLAWIILLLSACGDDLTDRFAELVQVSGATPFDATCGNGGDPSLHEAQEVEPSLAVDPNDARHFVAAWQQDRWTDGASRGLVAGASFDGGRTWTTTPLGMTTCAGGAFARASDPWVAIGGDGTAYAMGLTVDGARSGMAVARSSDGGATWAAPELIIDDDDPDVFNDKNSITADPTDPARVYATWDRLTGVLMPMKPIGTGPTMLARRTAGAWETARAIYDPGIDAQTIGNVIVVTRDGTLVDVFLRFQMASTTSPMVDLDVIRSIDHGDTWSAPIHIADLQAIGVKDPRNGRFVRTGEGLPAIASDPTSDRVYITWESRFGDVDGIALARSDDGGQTWGAPIQVNQDHDAQAYTPSVAVAADGAVGVTYYDTRDDDPVHDAQHFTNAVFLATSRDGGATWSEERLTGGFDLRPSQVGDVYFLGDYQALAASESTFVPFFVAAYVSPEDPTDVFVRPLPPP